MGGHLKENMYIEDARENRRRKCAHVCAPGPLEQTSCTHSVLALHIKCFSSKGRLNVVVVSNKASTGSGAVPGSVLGASLAASLAVEELVVDHARGVRSGALENAGGHVGSAALGLDGHVVALHVDFAGDIEGAVKTVESELAPGLGDLTVDELGVVVDGGPATADAGSERNIGRGAVGEGVGDQRLVDVDPAASRSPDDELNVLAGLVDELADVVTAGAQPCLATVAGLGVGTSKNTEEGKDVGDKATLLWDGSGVAESQVGQKNDEWDERKHVEIGKNR